MTATIKERGNAAWAVGLGVIGGGCGVIAGFLAMLFGGAGMIVEPAEGAAVVGLGLLAVAFGVLGLIGGALAVGKPGPATALMAIAGVGGFLTVLLFWIVPGPLLLIGAVLSWQSRETEERVPA